MIDIETFIHIIHKHNLRNYIIHIYYLYYEINADLFFFK